jgi:hypothetical protein
MDSRKCQTVTATPAKPGELPVGLGLRYELFPKEAQNACLIFSSELASRGANPWPADNQPRYFKSTHKGAPEVLTASLCSNGVENGVTKEQAEARIFIG